MTKKRKNKYEGIENIAKPSAYEQMSRGNQPEDDFLPNDVVRSAVSDMTSDEMSDEEIRDIADELTVRIVAGLSLLATNGKDDSLFGEDMNSFFAMYVNTLNLCGKFKKLLDDNGIDYTDTFGKK